MLAYRVTSLQVHCTIFTRHFTQLKNGEPAADGSLLLTAILADAFNLGLEKMAEACPGTSLSKLAWPVTWHIRGRSCFPAKRIPQQVFTCNKLQVRRHRGRRIVKVSAEAAPRRALRYQILEIEHG